MTRFIPAPTSRLRRDVLTASFAVVLTCIVAVPVLLAGTAHADPAVATAGWWTDRVSAAPLEGGAIEVAAAADGSSVGAVVVTNDIAIESATLVLTETGTPPAVTAGIVTCVISAPVTAANGAPLAEAPATGCEEGRALTRGVDRTWSVDVTDLLGTAPSVSLALIPVSSALTDSPLGGFDPGWVARFATFEVVATVPAESEPTTTTTTTASPTTTAAPSGGGAVPPTVAPTTTTPRRPSAIIPQPVAPPALTPTTFPPPPVAPVAEPVDESAAEELSVPSFNVGPITGSSDDGAPWVRLALLIPLSAATGAGTVFGRRLLDARA